MGYMFIIDKVLIANPCESGLTQLNQIVRLPALQDRLFFAFY
jgi:hypothetical protein